MHLAAQSTPVSVISNLKGITTEQNHPAFQLLIFGQTPSGAVRSDQGYETFLSFTHEKLIEPSERT